MNKKPLLARWWVRILLALLVLGLIAFLARNFLVRKGLETAVTEVTGFPLTIDSFDLGLFDSKVDVRAMHLANPPGFEDPRCISIRRLAADVELKTAFGDELHIEDLDIDIDEVVVVRTAAGETNLDRLKALGGEGGEAKGDGKPAGKAPDGKGPENGGVTAKPMKWRCDRLHLRLPKVVFLDYGSMRNGKPKQEVYDLKVDENFKDLSEPGAIVRIIVLKVLAGTPIRLARATVDTLTNGLGDVLGGTVKGVGGVVKGIGEGIGDGIGGILGGGGKKEEPPPPPKKPVKKK